MSLQRLNLFTCNNNNNMITLQSDFERFWPTTSWTINFGKWTMCYLGRSITFMMRSKIKMIWFRSRCPLKEPALAYKMVNKLMPMSVHVTGDRLEPPTQRARRIVAFLSVSFLPPLNLQSGLLFMKKKKRVKFFQIFSIETGKPAAGTAVDSLSCHDSGSFSRSIPNFPFLLNFFLSKINSLTDQ